VRRAQGVQVSPPNPLSVSPYGRPCLERVVPAARILEQRIGHHAVLISTTCARDSDHREIYPGPRNSFCIGNLDREYCFGPKNGSRGSESRGGARPAVQFCACHSARLRPSSVKRIGAPFGLQKRLWSLPAHRVALPAPVSPKSS
jgi:hypothetical protein